ncbi:MAG: hydantoinase B/oxoprolinase family protein [Chloroflexota bacterium]
MTQFDPLTLEILWQRLITVVDEMATILVRTSFSTVVGAANDFGCEIMDANGNSLAHATRSMPVFNRTLPNVTQAVVEKFGRDNLRPGDVFIANDPWLNAGHHPDVAIMTPFFREGQLMGFAANIAHLADLGGTLDSNQAREAYEEGLLIPMARLYDQGQLNEVIFDFIAGNVRVPEMVIGDIHAQVTANQAGSEKVLALMDEYALADLQPLAAEIQARSETAMRQAIAAVPDGDYQSQVFFDEFDGELTIQCRVSIAGDTLTVDFSGSSPQQPQGGINCTYTYAKAHASYGLKCILLPEVPSNSGCFRPINIEAPLGSVLNARYPASVRMRTKTGWYIHHALFAALVDVLPDQVMGAPGVIGGLTIFATDETTGKTHHSWFFNGGGMGAGATVDGNATTIYPSSASNVPIELFEVAVPVLVEEKEYLTDSGGPGRQRGGLGLHMAFRALDNQPITPISSTWLHGQNIPPFGLQGGGPANAAHVYLNGRQLSREEVLRDTGNMPLTPSDMVVSFDTTGGGGFGRPVERPTEKVWADVRDGIVSIAQAADIYGVIIDAETLEVDDAATQVRRETLQSHL